MQYHIRRPRIRERGHYLYSISPRGIDVDLADGVFGVSGGFEVLCKDRSGAEVAVVE